MKDKRAKTQVLKDGNWVKATPEPYYPNIVEKALHLVGIHQWTYPNPSRTCVICGRVK